jgi:hypothetical protein
MNAAACIYPHTITIAVMLTERMGRLPGLARSALLSRTRQSVLLPVSCYIKHYINLLVSGYPGQRASEMLTSTGNTKGVIQETRPGARKNTKGVSILYDQDTEDGKHQAKEQYNDADQAFNNKDDLGQECPDTINTQGTQDDSDDQCDKSNFIHDLSSYHVIYRII